LSVSDIDAELMEIDENLERHELTVLQRGEQMARRKELYEARHPTTKVGSLPGKPGGGKQAIAKKEIISSFADDTAQKAGVSPKTVQQEVKIAQDIDDEVKDAIRGTDLEDRKVDLLELSRLPKEEQGPVADEAIKEHTTVAKVKKKRGLGKPKKPKKQLEPKPEADDDPESDLDSEIDPEETPSGQTLLNGELVPDPLDIADRRRKGKIGKNAIPEVTQPDPSEVTSVAAITEEIDEEKAMTDDSLSDEDWLATLPLYNRLADTCLKTFREDALGYRSLEKHRKSFLYHVTRTVNKCRRNGPYLHRLKGFLKIEHPSKWLRCPTRENGGCGGDGTSPLTGRCSKCFGAGYWINH
jgi:hypothetical protein